MPISTPETEHAFRMYGSALEAKEAAKASLALLETALYHGVDLEPVLQAELEAAVGCVRHLLASATEAVACLRPTKIEDRGYSAVDREVGAFAKACGCGDKCGGCGGSGGCGGQTP
jgi:hypothetical protein